MTSATSRPASRTTAGAGRAGVVGDLAAATLVVLATAAPTWWLLALAASYWIVAGALYLGLAVAISVLAPADLPGPGLGAANRVTLFRAALFVPVAALCVPPVPLGEAGRWLVIGLGTVVMILDGVDGRVARRTGTRTRFGARFDMELDAALILALAVLVWTEGRAGVWCLGMGLMRYAYVAAGRAVPALRAELPDSYRRKAICVIQGVVLLVALGPIIPAAMAVTVVAAGLALLAYSFAVDVRWSLRQSAPDPS